MSELAQQLIQECRKSRSTHLDLGRCGLYDWPTALFELTWLESLNLRNRNWDEEKREWVPATANQGGYNLLRHIPAEIGKLQALQHLSLGGSGDAYIDWGGGSSTLIFHDEWQITDLQHISGLTQLQTLDLSFTQITDLQHISGLDQLQSLNIRNTQITDLQHISRLDQLQSLNLTGTQITDLQHISGLDQLQSLNLFGTKITDLQHISGLDQLQTLVLADTQITDLQHISGLDQLQTLDLSHTQITDLQHISGLDQLQSLNLFGTKITDLQHISGLDQLQSLDLSYTQITDLQHISGLDQLQTLNLGGTEITDLQHISGLDQLQTLNLSGTKITDLQHISGLDQLQSLNIGNTQITDLQHISGLDQLQSLDLSYTQITDLQHISGLDQLQTLILADTQIADLQHISGLDQLQSLDLTDTQITDLQHISGLVQLQSLNLFGTKITDLQHISGLDQLQTLNLEGTKITDLQHISGLVQLQSLNLFGTPITDLQHISGLDQLQSLDLSYTQITDLQHISGLDQLQTLNLGETKITDLQHISGIDQLQSLDLSYTQITDLQHISGLDQLQSLNLTGTQIIDLQHISGLVQLQTLNLWDTKITDLQHISGLDQLQTLDLRKTEVSDLKPLLPLIKRGIRVEWEEHYTSAINVYECPLSSPPPETVKRGNAAILAYFEELAAQGSAFLYEAKLLIVGEGGAGKTTLARKLLDPAAEMPTEAESTRGIDIFPLRFPLNNGNDFTLHIWDFGGQEIYHATHQFFLTKRSVYVLVDDTRKDDKTVNDASFNYWLQIVRLFGGGTSPLLIVQNEKGDRSKQLDLRGMQARFDFIKDSLPTNLQDERGLEAVKAQISLLAQRLPHIGQEVPKQWIAIRKNLEELAEDKPYIDDRDYYQLCTTHGIPERERADRLSEYLHDLGVFLHFQDDPLLRRYVILQNEWATDAAYRVLDDEGIKRKWGRFDQHDVKRLWKGKSYAYMHPELLAMMRKFELCYQLKLGHHLVPQLLPASEPAENQWLTDHNLQLRYRYDFMPKGLLSRFIVRMHRYVNNPDQAWKSGVILERENTKARVVEIYGKQELSIQIQGIHCKELLTLAAEEIDSLNESYEGIVVDKLVPCICRSCKGVPEPYFYRYQSLKKRHEKGKRTIECDNSYEDVNVEELLDAVFVADFKSIDTQSMKLFISYSKSDAKYLEALTVHLAPLRRQAGMIIWDDRTMVPGEEWDERIRTAQAQADIILLLVSPDSLATEYIQNVEVAQALERHERGEATVVPIILRPCDWLNEDIGRLSGLPKKGKPVSQYADQDEVFQVVVEGLKKVVTDIQERRR